MGQSIGGAGKSLLQSGLIGLGQGLQQYGAQQDPYSRYGQGFNFPQVNRPALGAGVTPNAKKRVNPLDPTNIDPFDPSAYGGQFPQ